MDDAPPPFTTAERHELAGLEKATAHGLARRVLLAGAVGALGGLAFAIVMRWQSGAEARFTLADRWPAYDAIESALGASVAFALLCALAFAGVGIVVAWRVWRAMAGRQRHLRERLALTDAAVSEGRHDVAV